MKLFLKLGSLSMVLALAAWGQLENFPIQPQDFMLRDSQGYLGVDLRDIGPDRVSALRLKDAHGTEVLAVDHDAPAAKAGLRAHDVLLAINGQPVEDCEQLRRILRGMPPGRTVALLLSRDGSPLNVTLQLADRTLLQQQAWSRHFSVPEPSGTADGGESFLGPRPAGGSRFLGTLIPNSLYIGADVNPVRAQLADYFGVTRGMGLLVENVDDQSPASRAGLKAGDVILKVDSHPMASRGDWLKAIRNSRGQLVQVTIMRDKQEQTVAMSAGAPKKGH